MFSFLKTQPFSVEAHFETSVVLTFAVPKEQLQALIPVCLRLDTFDDKWAFLAVAIVKTKNLRPKGLPKILGSDFFLIGYRIFVRYRNSAGKSLRGLYILKSATNKKKMELLGNIFTEYKYTTTDVTSLSSPDTIEVISTQSGLNVLLKKHRNDEIGLPIGSPFSDWKQARRFAGPLPFTFSFNADRNEVLIIEGVREHWVQRPLTVLRSQVGFPGSVSGLDFALASAFVVEDVAYSWKKGKVEKWQP
jgi:uncharacterized protein DUF2071